MRLNGPYDGIYNFEKWIEDYLCSRLAFSNSNFAQIQRKRRKEEEQFRFHVFQNPPLWFTIKSLHVSRINYRGMSIRSQVLLENLTKMLCILFFVLHKNSSIRFQSKQKKSSDLLGRLIELIFSNLMRIIIFEKNYTWRVYCLL